MFVSFLFFAQSMQRKISSVTLCYFTIAYFVHIAFPFFFFNWKKNFLLEGDELFRYFDATSVPFSSLNSQTATYNFILLTKLNKYGNIEINTTILLISYLLILK